MWAILRGQEEHLVGDGVTFGVVCLLPEQRWQRADPWLVMTLSRHEQTPSPREVRLLAPGVAALKVPSQELAILALARPWDDPVRLLPLLEPGERTLVVSACGTHAGVWHDGPLAHVLADGSVASYLPAGGGAALLVPPVPLPALRGMPLNEALTAEGDDGERAHRCLLAQTAARLAATSQAAAGVWRLSLGDYSLATALSLVLVRQAALNAKIVVHLTPTLTKPPAPWRRLCQNLNVHLAEPGTQSDLDLTPPIVASTHARSLLASINAVSDIVPRSLAEL